MKIGFGISRQIVDKESAGGGRFSSLLKQCLLAQGHKVTFNLKEDIDILYDVANNITIAQFKEIQQRGVPIVFRMDGLGGIKEDRSSYLQKCQLADCVVFQSLFCQRCVKMFVQPRHSVVIYNGVLIPEEPKKRRNTPMQILLYNRPQNAWGRQLGAQDWIDIVDKQESKLTIVKIDGSRHFTRSNLHDLMEKSDIFIHTSYYEACSNALLEAMSLGCAVLSTDDSGNAEIIGTEGCIVKTDEAVRKINYNLYTHKDCDFLPKIEMNREHAKTQLSRCIQGLEHFRQYSFDRVKRYFDINQKAQEYIEVMLSLKERYEA
jgi:glycosyltransferase involved in cell wall biosynthesis